MVQCYSRRWTVQVTVYAAMFRRGVLLAVVALPATLASAEPPSPDAAPQQRLDWIRQAITAPGPDVESQLVAMAQHDDCEAVRFEAVSALRSMLAQSAGVAERRVVMTQPACPPRRGLIGRLLSRVLGTPRSQRMVAVPAPAMSVPVTALSPCCEPATRDALLAIAAGHAADGQPLETSPRVRTAASEALALCERLGTCRAASPPGSPGNPRPHSPKHGHGAPLIEEPPPGSAGFEPLAFRTISEPRP